MKNTRLTYISALTLLGAIVVPVQVAAQGKQNYIHNPHHYQLVDLGSTFGGPQSYFNPASGLDIGQHTAVLNSSGTVAGFADTSLSDPFPNFCFWDCLVVHAFRAHTDAGLTDLGALPGGGSSVPTWITANGLVTGVSENGETDPLFAGLPQLRAVLWQPGAITDLGTLPEGGYQSEANAVNSSGQVGAFWLWGGIAPPYQYQTRAFLWDAETGMQDLGTLGGTDAQALLINERGQVVGLSYTGSTASSLCPYPLATDSFLWTKEKGMVDLGSLGGTCTLAQDMNERGQIVGTSNSMGDQSEDAFLWERGQLHHLGGSLGGDFTGAFAISQAGKAVGFGYLAGNANFHATLWRRIGKITDLGVIGDDQCSYAAAINTNEEVVGSSIPTCDSDPTSFRAFLWEKGTMFDLNNLVPSGSSLYLQYVETINDRGEIAGQGLDGNGNEHAFLLIPCDKDHPNVEGCNYNMADASAAATAATAPAKMPMAPVRPIFRLQSPLRTPTRDAKSSSVTVAGGNQTDFVADSLLSPEIHGRGYCIVNNQTHELTGACHAGNAWVCWSGRSSACPSGTAARKPEKSGCGLFGSIIIDAARDCSF
jgi:probable HAF family extracellular repeat protein